MQSILLLLDTVIGLYTWIIIASAVMSWLVAFNVINPRNQFVAMIGETVYKLTEPALRPIRRVLPNLGGIDISPIVLLLILFFVRSLLRNEVARMVL
ncbi:MAG: YggT family protein [Pseudomonadota bacterium]